MNKSQRKMKFYYEVAFSGLLILNAILLLYFIIRLNQIESLAKDTQAQAKEIFEALE